MAREAAESKVEQEDHRRADAAAPLAGLPPGVRLGGQRSWVLVLTQASLRLATKVLAVEGLDAAGLELVPSSGPLLLCSNHVSNFDPLLLGASIPRVMHAMAKAEMFHNPLLRSYLEHCNCFPVRRGEADRAAMRAALAILRDGGVVVLFPEGHRSRGRGLIPFEAGAGYLALRSSAPVLPCGIWGTERVLPKGALRPRRAPLHLRVGMPFVPAAKRPAEVSREIRQAVAGLLPMEYRGSPD